MLDPGLQVLSAGLRRSWADLSFSWHRGGKCRQIFCTALSPPCPHHLLCSGLWFHCPLNECTLTGHIGSKELSSWQWVSGHYRGNTCLIYPIDSWTVPLGYSKGTSNLMHQELTPPSPTPTPSSEVGFTPDSKVIL